MTQTDQSISKKPRNILLRLLGPGLVTGAADDDPSGIATYSQAGAQFGFSLLWTVFLTLPFMAAIQIISACIGWDTRQGLARNIARVLPAWALYPLVASLLVANTINIAADLAAMGEALRLGRRRLRAGLCGYVRDRLPGRRGADPLSPLRRLSE